MYFDFFFFSSLSFEQEEQAKCPLEGCSDNLALYNKTYGFDLGNLSWGYSEKSNVVFHDIDLFAVKYVFFFFFFFFSFSHLSFS